MAAACPHQPKAADYQVIASSVQVDESGRAIVAASVATTSVGVGEAFEGLFVGAAGAG